MIDGAANDLGTNSNDSWHNGTIKNCQVYGTNLSNTVGNGIGVFQPGEANIVQQNIIANAPQDGFYITGDMAGTGVFIANSAFNSNGCGFDFYNV